MMFSYVCVISYCVLVLYDTGLSTCCMVALSSALVVGLL